MSKKQISIEESIRLNQFVERIADRKDERFCYFGIWWNVTKMYEYIRLTGKRPVEFSMAQLAGAGTMVEIDEEYARIADLSNPGIVIDLTPHHLLLVDGNHRFYRARSEGRSVFTAYHLTLNEQKHFITDKDGYKTLKRMISAALNKGSFAAR